MEMLVIFSVALPELVKVTVLAGLLVLINCVAYFRVVGLSVTAGAVPVPERATVCTLPSVKLRVPVRAPTTVGVKVTLAVQLLPIATVAQSSVWEKSPVVLTPLTAKGAIP